MKISSLLCGLLLGLAGSAQVLAQATPAAALDALHKAGADANQAAFTALLTKDVVFLGMDGANRLEGPSVRAFVSENLAHGNAWTYRSSQRETRVSEDGSVAWFDESLEHDQRGRGRGTGVLVRNSEGWRIAQYNLTLPLPSGTMPTAGAVGTQVITSPGAANNPPPADTQATGAQEKPRCRMISHKTNTRAECWIPRHAEAMRDEMMAHIGAIVSATDLPVSADLENGFGDDPA
jgi:hypothetical protein